MSAREWPLEGADRTCHTAMHGLQKRILPVQCDSGNGTTEYWYIKHLMFPSLSQAVLEDVRLGLVSLSFHIYQSDLYHRNMTLWFLWIMDDTKHRVPPESQRIIRASDSAASGREDV
ncbi:hypothetical protein GX48_01697 [Paracoccidioides brasiliensis]|nr:hypothetical protein GX48_01697 [Paracoccidioides brasiliensis]